MRRGACYFNTENNDCPTGGMLATATRNANIKNFASQITGAGLSWLYWQVIPNADPHVRIRLLCRAAFRELTVVWVHQDGADFEIGVTGDPSWSTLQAVAKAASSASSTFDFSEFLL